MLVEDDLGVQDRPEPAEELDQVVLSDGTRQVQN